MNQERKTHCTTTFQISNHLHTQLKMMCVLTKKSMGEIIRLAIKDKIRELKGRENDHSSPGKAT
jgi:hypothetical protein